jgi:RHS repeat-associated protein
MKTRGLLASIVAVLCAVPAPADPPSECDACRVSLKRLDLSQAPSHEDLIRAGQLGGALSPTGPETASTAADRWLFGRAIDAWNDHDYGRAKELFRQHLKDYPASPWAAEAELHLGCEARFSGRYGEADAAFRALVVAHGSQTNAYGDVARKARVRLAMLDLMRGEFVTARDEWAEIIREDPDPMRRDYARYWILRTLVFQTNAVIVRRCGAEAVERVAAALRPGMAAPDRGTWPPADPAVGLRADQLLQMAAGRGLDLAGIRVAPTDRLAPPFVAHYAFNHFVAVMRREGERGVWVFDPILGHETLLSDEEFSREWSGVALVAADGVPAGLIPLSGGELQEVAGGCCGTENTNQDQGEDEDNEGGSPTEDGCGMSVWSMNPKSANLFITDTPLWYDPPYGPPIRFTMSYNSIDSDVDLPSFGPKWSFSYHARAMETPASGGTGVVTVYRPDGRNDVFFPTNGGYRPPGRVFDRLTRTGTNRYELLTPEGTTLYFGQPAGATNVQQALLTSIVDRHSNAVTIVYDGQADPKIAGVVDALSRTSRIEYSASGLITNIVDPFGRRMTVSYSNGHPAVVRDMGGVESRYTWFETVDETNRPQSMRSNCGEVSFTWRLSDGIAGHYSTSITNLFANGAREIMSYNGEDGIFKNRNGLTTRYTLTIASDPPYQGLIEAVGPEGYYRTVYFKYDESLQATNITDWLGRVWTNRYNEVGRLIRHSAPDGYSVDLSYTNDGLDVAEVYENATNLVNTLTYTAARDVETVADALGRTNRFAYDAQGRLTNATDAAGLASAFQFGADGWLASASRAGVTLSTLAHDAIGRTTNAVGPAGVASSYGYDDLDRLVEMRVAGGRPYRWFWPTNSLLLESRTDRTGRRVQYEYDNMERVQRVTSPDASSVLFEYGPADNLTGVLDQEGHRTQFKYNSRLMYTNTTYAGGERTRVQYGDKDLPESAWTPDNSRTDFTYSRANILTNLAFATVDATKHPAPGPAGWTLDARRRVTRRADGWSTNTYAFDAGSRVTGRTEIASGATQQFAYAYDVLGRLTNLTWSLGTNTLAWAYRFDDLGRLTNLMDSSVGAFSWRYTNAGLTIARMDDPFGGQAAYAYDQLGRMTSLVYSTGEAWRYAYDERDYLTAKTDPEGNQFEYGYDNDGRLVSAEGRTPTNDLAGYPQRYDYDRAGNRIGDRRGSEYRSYDLNVNNQIVAVHRTNGITVRGWVTAPATNVLVQGASTNWQEASVRWIGYTQQWFEAFHVPVTNGTNCLVVQAQDYTGGVAVALRTVDVAAVSLQVYTNDKCGNLTSLPGVTNLVFVWDGLDRLAESKYIWTSGTKAVTSRVAFAYDLDSRLREMREYGTNGLVQTTTRYVWEGWTLLAELDGSNRISRSYTWGPDLSGTIGGAGGIGGLLAISQGQSNALVRTDGKGNVTEVRSTNGTVLASCVYDPWGRVLSNSGAFAQPFRFQTKLNIGNAGLVYFGHRWYNTYVGRWLTRDPIGTTGGLNLYVFCGNNPINFIEPLGLSFAESYAASGAIGGGTAVAIGSLAVDAVTGGLNVLATPAEIGLGAALGAAVGYEVGSLIDMLMEPHTKGTRPSTKQRHEEGEARKRLDRGNEKGDLNRRPPRRRPDDWKGPWPPKSEGSEFGPPPSDDPSNDNETKENGC